MKSQDQVREVFPEAFVSVTADQAIVYSALDGERLEEASRQEGAWTAAWVEIERRGTLAPLLSHGPGAVYGRRGWARDWVVSP